MIKTGRTLITNARLIDPEARTVTDGSLLIEEGRIALDTGAYDTGVLTAVRLHPDMPPKILQCHA